MPKILVVLTGVVSVLMAAAGLLAGEGDSLEGKPAPDFTLDTLAGKSVKLSEQRGKVVLLDIWTTWCPPCQWSLPHLQDFANNKDFARQGLVVWAVNAAEGQAAVAKFIGDNMFTFTVLLDPAASVGQTYSGRRYPTTVLIGRDGVVKRIFIGYGADSPKDIEEATAAALLN